MKFAIFERSSFTRKGKYACVIVAFVVSLYFFWAPANNLEWHYQNYLFRARDTGTHCEELRDSKMLAPVALILIDDESISKRNLTWPVPRSLYCRLIEELEEISPRPRVIGLDLMFPDQSQSSKEDAELASLFRKFDNLVVGNLVPLADGDQNVINPYFAEGFECADEASGKLMRFPGLSKAKKKSGLGFVNSAHSDSTGVERKATLLLTKGDTTYYSFDVLLLTKYQDISLDDVKDFSSQGYQMIGDIRVPVERGTMWINYLGIANYGDCDTLFSTYRLDDILEEKDKKNLKNNFGDKIVIVGASATGAYEKRETPFGPTLGAIIRVNILSTLTSKEFLNEASAVSGLLLMLIPSIVLALLIPYVSPAAGALIFVLCISGISGLSSHAFMNRGILFNPASAILSLTLSYSYMIIFSLIRINKARNRLKNLLRQLAPLPEPIMERIIERQKGKVALGGEKIELTILFSDIRGYTNLSQNLDPREVMNTLNEYYSSMGAIYKNNGGMIFDTMGDGQMVVFGVDDRSKDNHAFMAVKAAVEMREKLKELNEVWKEERRNPLSVGIGINTGEVSLGFLGAGDRKQFSAIGDTTNVASRIEGLTKTLNANIIISDTTYEKSRYLIDVSALPSTKVKGKDEPLKLYSVDGVKCSRELRDKMQSWCEPG